MLHSELMTRERLSQRQRLNFRGHYFRYTFAVCVPNGEVVRELAGSSIAICTAASSPTVYNTICTARIMYSTLCCRAPHHVLRHDYLLVLFFIHFLIFKFFPFVYSSFVPPPPAYNVMRRIRFYVLPFLSLAVPPFSFASSDATEWVHRRDLC